MTDLLPGISVGMLVKDPPIDRLSMLVDYLAPYVDEFVIVDTGSPEPVIEKMRNFPHTRVLQTEFVDFSQARNFGIAQHLYEWTLVVDPDELPSAAMLDHIIAVVAPDRTEAGWLFWTRNWWDGVLGPAEEYHWHLRLFRTARGRFYRPVHELVEIDGRPEEKTRGRIVPKAPSAAHLIHSKSSHEIAKADSLYFTMGEVSR